MLTPEELNKLLRHHAFCFNLSYSQGCVVLPLLVDSEAELLVFEDDRDITFLFAQDEDSLIKKLLL